MFTRPQRLHTQLNTNAVSVQSDSRNGRLGNYRLVANTE